MGLGLRKCFSGIKREYYLLVVYSIVVVVITIMIIIVVVVISTGINVVTSMKKIVKKVQDTN